MKLKSVLLLLICIQTALPNESPITRYKEWHQRQAERFNNLFNDSEDNTVNQMKESIQIPSKAPESKSTPHPQQQPQPPKTKKQGTPTKSRAWGYGNDEDPSWGKKGLNFLSAGGSFAHSTVGHTGNILGQVVSKTSHGLSYLLSGLGNSIDTSKSKETIALGLGYSFLGWALWRLYHWKVNDHIQTNQRTWATFLLPDWTMTMFGWN